MTLRHIYRQMGSLQEQARAAAQQLEVADQVAERYGSPLQAAAAKTASRLRRLLQGLYTRLHALEARIPTPETLSAAAYNRMIALGMQIDAAEAERVRVYRESKGLGFPTA